MKVYTKTGDNGTTGLFGGTRVPKYHIRIDSYGTIDELNSWLGLIRDQDISKTYQNQLIQIQEHLFVVGAILATDPEKETLKNGEQRLKITKVGVEEIRFLENAIDEMDNQLPQMTHFILPGGHTTVSYCHIARTVCRRAERMATSLFESEAFDVSVLSFINRLSDYLFVLARKLSYDLQANEIKWIPKKKD
jgi:cob(I)alamin adenosyltransferase